LLRVKERKGDRWQLLDLGILWNNDLLECFGTLQPELIGGFD